MKHRKTIRLKEYDYSAPGYYFVTMVTHNRKCYFGNVAQGEMELSTYGQIIDKQWQWLKQKYPYVDLDVYTVMPNHFHGILIITPVGNGLDRSEKRMGQDPSLQKSLPLYNLIGAFKTTSSKFIHQAGLNNFSWQKSFYDHVIRKDESLEKIREYIVNNPLQWELDAENPKNFENNSSHALS